ncbi:MAG: hypothetical protein LBG82_02025, partial [Clostridiales Family XIII bacterium]|nr:hypothetical protein [Clostridiales Family XIII bacterium]
MGAEIDACFNDAPPPCQAVCPFGLDVCAFAERVSSGRFSSAYRMLSEKLLFPEIVHELCERPCEGICLRGDIDGPIRIGQLEKAAIEFGAEPPKRYSIPEQGKSVAVACGGLSGAAVALLLGSAGYSVKLFEKDGELSGRLAEGFAAETYLPQIMERLEAAKCEIVTGHEVKDISELDGYDAVVLPVGGADGSGVTGGVGGLCGNGGMGGVDRADGRNGVGGADVGERVFFCGIGDDEPGALAVVRAMEVASQIQGWLKTGVRFAGDGQERHAAGSGGGVGACGSGSGEAGGSECGVGAGGSGSGGSGSGSGEAAGGVYLSEDSGLDGKRLDVLKAIYKDTPPSERTGDT